GSGHRRGNHVASADGRAAGRVAPERGGQRLHGDRRDDRGDRRRLRGDERARRRRRGPDCPLVRRPRRQPRDATDGRRDGGRDRPQPAGRLGVRARLRPLGGAGPRRPWLAEGDGLRPRPLAPFARRRPAAGWGWPPRPRTRGGSPADLRQPGAPPRLRRHPRRGLRPDGRGLPRRQRGGLGRSGRNGAGRRDRGCRRRPGRPAPRLVASAADPAGWRRRHDRPGRCPDRRRLRLRRRLLRRDGAV
ncbi:MAG: hypothetical protein AVDCRST_MAG59-1843, partial [uncultured Thermomicrobiales bacterium]